MYLVIMKTKKEYGPMMTALMKTGIQIKTVDEVEPEDEIIIFHNKPINIKAKKVGWYMCDLREPQKLANGATFDYIFLCNKEHLEEYEEVFGKEDGSTKAYYVPQCGDESPILKDSYWDVVFIGNFNSEYHQNREVIIREIQDKFNLKIIAGRGYTPENKYLYRDTPISLAISPPVEGYTSNRLYNILSVGGFCLTLYYPGIEEQFERGVHLDWFETPEEANEKIKYYLEHPKERKRIAKAGQEIYNKEHTGQKRLDTMFSYIEKDKNLTKQQN